MNAGFDSLRGPDDDWCYTCERWHAPMDWHDGCEDEMSPPAVERPASRIRAWLRRWRTAADSIGSIIDLSGQATYRRYAERIRKPSGESLQP